MFRLANGLRASELERELLEASRFQGLIGRSPKMLDMFSTMRRVAPHYRSLLITGQTGSGKDLVARAVHQLSPASSGNFVVVNCSAVVETLFESELFGHVKGSFTGADRDKVGLVEHASGGTLFLDEIGDMPLSTQAKLLRVLQNQEVQRVGSLTPHKVDVRVVAATNKNLRSAIAGTSVSGGSVLPSDHGRSSYPIAGRATRRSSTVDATLSREVFAPVR